MATKKPKSSAKSKTTKSTKSKAASVTAEKSVAEAPITTKVEKTETKSEVITSSASEKKSIFSGLFAKKYEAKESILTIFKDYKFYGSLLGEIIGTMLITLLLFALSLMGLSSIATYSFAVIAIFIGVYAFSGACLNPIITAGMMATRRMSVIRGVMYIVAEIIGAWLGWLIFNAFHLAGGDSAYAIPVMSQVADGQFAVVAMIEFLAAIIVAFFYARAIKYKRSAFTFGAIVAGGFAFVMVVSYVVSAAFLGLSSNFIVNPAAALMFQIFPSSGDGFGEIFGGICQALSIYALLPMLGGILGFYVSDFTAKLSGNED
ncbi:MAG: aquaporin [Candidatus Saccharibacteria bacterium]|nr:aquaporin [Candidatus Saccharibacteria bacterium]